MALDGMMLHHIINELKTRALNSRVNQIYQPNRDEIIIVLRTHSGNKRLLLSARANSPRIGFTDFPAENPPSPPMLCMLMRKKLGGGRLTDIRQWGLDRIASFDFECVNELGDRVVITVVAEIMGKYSNVILVNGDGVIIDALKRVDLSMSSQRLVLPNTRYEYPPAQDKLNILLTKPQAVARRITSAADEKPLNKAILNSVQGISPIVCRELEYKICGENTDSRKQLDEKDTQRLAQEIETLADMVLTSSGTPTMVSCKGDKRPLDITFMRINQYSNMGELKTFESFSQLLDSYYSQRDSADRMRVKTADLTKLLNNLIHRVSNKINVRTRELSACADREQLRIKGDLLQANLYRVPRGAEKITVENFYDEANAPIEIKLDPALSPAKNAQKYYKDYNKAKTAAAVLTVRIEKAKEELVYLDSLKDELSRVTSERELNAVRREFEEQGYIKAPRTAKKALAKLPPLEYKTSDGFTVLVGRNNRQNDLITLKTASKTDVWFHTKDIPGSHTVVLTQGGELSETAALEAARIAAYHSKARESTNVPVDYTLIKYVSKPTGARPGMVIFTHNRTLYVDPGLPR